MEENQVNYIFLVVNAQLELRKARFTNFQGTRPDKTGFMKSFHRLIISLRDWKSPYEIENPL